MKVELKNVKINQRLSEETTCFSADVWIDGKKVCYAANRGCGGPNEYHPLDIKKWEKWEKFEEWVKTLPDLPATDDYPALKMDADLYIGDLLEKWDRERQVKIWCRTKTVFLLDGEDPEKGGYRTVEAKFSPAVKAFLVKKYGKKLSKIINQEIQQ
jgi:hypothetical protein